MQLFALITAGVACGMLVGLFYVLAFTTPTPRRRT